MEFEEYMKLLKKIALILAIVMGIFLYIEFALASEIDVVFLDSNGQFIISPMDVSSENNPFSSIIERGLVTFGFGGGGEIPKKPTKIWLIAVPFLLILLGILALKMFKNRKRLEKQRKK